MGGPAQEEHAGSLGQLSASEGTIQPTDADVLHLQGVLFSIHTAHSRQSLSSAEMQNTNTVKSRDSSAIEKWQVASGVVTVLCSRCA